jgi:uncharacterized protein (TIGR02453 family)
MTTVARDAITARTFAFLAELGRNNDRRWFEANKERYLRDVRDPLLAFIAAFAPRLARINRHLIADPRPVGGSLFRIHRDIRFSRDKSPYKTHAGMSFRHAGGRDVHGPVFYLHFEPGMVFAAAGIWHPSAETLRQVRDAIVERPDRWKRAIRACPLDDHGDLLKRPPRGYDLGHPLVTDLKRQSFTTSTRFTERDACAPSFLDRFEKACRGAVPLMEFLTRAVGLPW